jgi:glycosyltransferase involved in cell wall biosynthesis
MRLLSQVRGEVPKLVLCGVVGNAIIEAGKQTNSNRRNWVVYSGTHSKPQGLEQLIKAWKIAKLPGWELHIAGHGAMTATLHTLAEGNTTIVFHGLLDRKQNAAMLGTGKIGIVPYDVSTTQGFSFKTIECLAAGLHVITTPLTALEDLEPELKAGITYIADNSPTTIAASLEDVIRNERYGRTVAAATVEKYGPNAITRTLDVFVKNVVAGRPVGGEVKQKAGVATSCG